MHVLRNSAPAIVSTDTISKTLIRMGNVLVRTLSLQVTWCSLPERTMRHCALCVANKHKQLERQRQHQ